MKNFQFIAAFRERESDEDRFSKYLRMLEAAHGAAVSGSLLLMLSTAVSVYRGQPPDDEAGGVLVFVIVMFFFLGSYKAGELLFRPLRRHIVAAFMILALVAVEAATALEWWSLSVILRGWRRSVLMLAVAYLLLWGGERAVRIRRSRPRNS